MVKGSVVPELYALKNLLYTTCRIVTFDKNGDADGIGTGFFYHVLDSDQHGQDHRIELLITNKHVIKDAFKGSLIFHLEPVVNGFPSGGTYELIIDDFESKFFLHPNPEIDLCALDLSKHFTDIRKKKGVNVYYQAFTSLMIPDETDLKKLFPVTDVYMVGYPEGIWDKVNNLPITRKGVTASHPFFDFNARPEGAVDIAAFQGSSGSPIISYEYGPPTYDKPFPVIFRLLGFFGGENIQLLMVSLLQLVFPQKQLKYPART